MKQYFGTDGIRGRVGSTAISPDWILKLGWAVGNVLADHNKLTSKNLREHAKVLIGKDTRISGYMFESALEAGLASAGVDTYLLGPMPTPGIAYLTRTFQGNIGIVISASHNPYYDNGIKFFSQAGLKIADEMELAIEAALTKPIQIVDSAQIGRAARINDAAGRYIEFCKSTFPQQYNLAGLNIVVDCAHGATYHIAPSVFKELGAKVTVIGAEPDGLNINLQCGSTALDALQAKVSAVKADLGIAFDGDGDRTIFVDQYGNILDGDELLFIIARWYQATKQLSGGVVGTLMSNLGFEQALADLQIPFFRTQVGDRYVLEALNHRRWNLGGEASGHILCLNRHTTGDGIIAALQVLAALCATQTSLAEQRTLLKKYPQILRNVPVKQLPNMQENLTVQQAIKQAELALKGQGRVLIRPSGTEPVVRIMVEGNDHEQIKVIADELAELVAR